MNWKSVRRVETLVNRSLWFMAGLGVALGVMLCQVANADIISATVRVRSGDGIGTGCVFAVQGDTASVLTNFHVAGSVGTTVKVTFWQRGYRSVPVAGRVVWSSYKAGRHRDIAVVQVPLAALGGYVPPAIPFAGANAESGATVLSVGCSGGSWPTLFRGRVLATGGGVMKFLPPPAGGRSGSAIFSEDGSTIVGLLAWRSDGGNSEREGGHGLAMTVSELRAAFSGRASVGALRDGYSLVYETVDTPGRLPVLPLLRDTATRPFNCPDGNCPTGPGQGFGFQHRRDNRQNPPAAGNPFPGLTSNTSDIRGLERRLYALESKAAQYEAAMNANAREAAGAVQAVKATEASLGDRIKTRAKEVLVPLLVETARTYAANRLAGEERGVATLKDALKEAAQTRLAERKADKEDAAEDKAEVDEKLSLLDKAKGAVRERVIGAVKDKAESGGLGTLGTLAAVAAAAAGGGGLLGIGQAIAKRKLGDSELVEKIVSRIKDRKADD
ncbi:hypothetical protein LCGC14_1012410 [marine sediment metagenome]|uniref:Serine protease n=1 Tax=marine sediment metagenome TaxID=412755 RepID=A0A0F9MZX3_9ZZZZ